MANPRRGPQFMITLTDEQLFSLLQPEEIISAVREAMIWDEEHPGNVPQRMHINRGDDTFLLMPAFGPGFHGTKLVSVIPANSNAGRAVISGSYLLYDSSTGEPIMMTGAGMLTALRTGAIAAVAAQALSAPDTHSLGIIGCGVQGISAARLIPFVRPIKKIFCHSRSVASLENFRKEVRGFHPEIEIIFCKDSSEVQRSATTLVLATTSAEPVLADDEKLLAEKCLIALGAYRTNMRELPDAAFRLSGAVILDAEGGRHETGDARVPVEKGLISEKNIFTLGKVLLGHRKLDSGTRVFKSAGYALFDLFTAKMAADKFRR